jgi:mannose-6-phosphate isomerase-like protein (cupin superfamily)
MQPDQTIGAKIAILRGVKNIDPEILAKKAALSVQQLNLIETGTSIPSLGVLIKITRALGIRLGTLLDDSEKEGPSIVRANERQQSVSFSTHEDKSREHLTFYAMAPKKAGRHMEPFIVDIVAGKHDHLPKSSHEGEEFIYVLEGKISIQYGTDIFNLEKDDSIYLDSIVEHLVTNPGPAEARILGIVYVPV